MGECDKNLRRQRETFGKRVQHKVERENLFARLRWRNLSTYKLKW